MLYRKTGTVEEGMEVWTKEETETETDRDRDRVKGKTKR